jgi:putative ABC transport system permease protein
MFNDIKFAFRQLCKSPGFAAIAMITLALGIGVNSAVFALINSVVLRPMVPLRANEVVRVFKRYARNEDSQFFLPKHFNHNSRG